MFEEKQLLRCVNLPIDWEKIDGKRVLITGATGLIGKYLILVLIKRNQIKKGSTKIIAVGRNKEKFWKRFENVADMNQIEFIEHDVKLPIKIIEHVDYIFHMASNTHPRLYATKPIDTEMSNILGTYNLLNLAANNKGCRFVFASSGDIYGDNRGECSEFIEEDECGYINCNTLRAGYIEGKRASEALCNAFKEEKGIDFVTARFCRIYGSTMQMEDSKAITQFIKKAAASENIILKSKGTQTFSYLHISDAVSALLYIMANGENGNAYNVASNDQCIALKNLAELLAQFGGGKVVFDVPDDIESKGASTFQNVMLSSTKLEKLGWRVNVSMEDGLKSTVDYFRANRIKKI